MPDTRTVDGVPLLLNGIALRTFSILSVHVYVAGLYLEHRTDDFEAILHSKERKLLHIKFVHDVSAEEARDAWNDGLEKNCRAPCHLAPNDVQRFLAGVPAIHKGDESTLLFTAKGVHISLNGRTMGDIRDPHFAEIVLATFIGREPATQQLKRGLLGRY